MSKLVLSTLLVAIMVGETLAAAPVKVIPKNDGNTKDTIVLTNRQVRLDGGIRGHMIQSAQRDFWRYDKESNEPIWLMINSPGGSVEAGLILIDTFQALKSPVYCLIESRAYSMAAITLVFCDKKYILRHGTIMLHEASYGTMGEDPQIRSRLAFITKYLDGVHHEIAKRIGWPHDKYRAKIRDAWWLLADEAAKVGLVDGVVKHIIYKEMPVESVERKRSMTRSVETVELPPEIKADKIQKRRD